MEDKDYMLLALKEANIAKKNDEVPIGAIIVKDGEIIARGHNRKVEFQDVTRHAEIEAIRKAQRKLKTWHLDGCFLYVTLEPCLMCTGAIIQSRIKKVIFGAKDLKGGALCSNIKINEVKGLNHYPEIDTLLQEECSIILKEYFKDKRNKKY